jgi:precorrin-6B methylase 2
MVKPPVIGASKSLGILLGLVPGSVHASIGKLTAGVPCGWAKVRFAAKVIAFTSDTVR